MKIQPCTTNSCTPGAIDNWLANPFAGFAAFAPLFDVNRSSVAPEGRAETNVWEDEGKYVASFDLPGVKKEDVKLEVQDRSLSLTATRKDARPGSDKVFTYTRRLSLPRTVATDKIEAQLEDGVLILTLPKVEAAQPRTIAIN